MSTPEGRVKDWFIRKIKKQYPGTWAYKAPGGIYGKAGTPDILLCVCGLFVAVEVKAKSGTMATKRQLVELKKIVGAKGVAAILSGKDEDKVESIFKKIEEHRTHDLRSAKWR